MICWLFNWFIYRLIDRSIDRLIDWFIKWLAHGLVDWSTDRLSDSFINWLISWLIDSVINSWCCFDFYDLLSSHEPWPTISAKWFELSTHTKLCRLNPLYHSHSLVLLTSYLHIHLHNTHTHTLPHSPQSVSANINLELADYFQVQLFICYWGRNSGKLNFPPNFLTIFFWTFVPFGLETYEIISNLKGILLIT